MPRKARIDAPGAVHHIIVRGIERHKIFRDDHDRDNFLKRLGDLVIETQTQCFAWALIPNHFHLLLKTGQVPVATVMQRLLTGYAIGFNRRYCRSGHLFQNRYKSILCQEDVYLKELVRYIHLNPLRAGLVPDLATLDGFRFVGHSYLMGKRKNGWQSTDSVLAFFGDHISSARRRYRGYLKKGIALGRRSDLVGGGLVRSAGGWAAVRSMRKNGAFLKSDERILGDSDFVDTVLSDAQEAMQRKYALAARGIDLNYVVVVVSDLFSIHSEDIVGPCKQRDIVKARMLVCYWAVRELGLSMTEVAGKLGISVSTVSVAVKKGAQTVRHEGLVLTDLI
ncbi:MAG: transposase [Desulfobacteraceae bacterium]|nr:transposase [Desulfobacteraceae bacterium]